MDYDVGAAFDRIETELINSMIRNMDRHRAEELKEGYNWEMWQALQLKQLERYKRLNAKKYKGQFKDINNKIELLIRQANRRGYMSEEVKILDAIKKGFFAQKSSEALNGAFFRVNERKLDALIQATVKDMNKAETAILRMANDQYRKAIFNAQVYANTGAGTYEKAVDMATKDMLAAGLNCVQYKNGARHTLANYARMAIRTANKRAYLQGEGAKRQEWGISTVIVNKRNGACPLCMPFVGKVMIDDVWSGGKPTDGPYMLLSSAMQDGFYHPNCKDSHSTYFPMLDDNPEARFSRRELKEIEEDYRQEQLVNYANRQAEKYTRLVENSLSKENQDKYKYLAEKWENTQQPKKKNYFYVISPKELYPDSVPGSHQVKDAKEYIKDGVKYVVDGHDVILKYEESEKRYLEILERVIGGEAYMLPRVNKPDGIRAPDFLFNGYGYDLKRIRGSGKNTLIDAIKKKRGQSTKFIFGITEECKLTNEEIIEQSKHIFEYKRTDFVDEIIVIKDDTIITILKRN